MQSFKKACIGSICVIIVFTLISCDGLGKKKRYADTDLYDFSKPKVIKLPEIVDELSGIAYYPKDTSVFGIVDEDGLLFKIPIMNPTATKHWRFDKKRDYEDIIYKDSIFYILVSNGDIVTVKFNGNTISAEKADFSTSSKKANEFEAMYVNSDSGKIIIVCKECEDDTKKTFSSYTYDYLGDKSYNLWMTTDAVPIAKKMGLDKVHLKASAAAINPVTEDLYILSTVNNVVVIASKKGEVKQVIQLNPGIYKQAEGMAFTPEGDLIISNEFADNGFAELLIMKNKKKGR